VWYVKVYLLAYLYRLAHGIPLHLDDPVDAALAYREKMAHFF
jgi:hypothetical protein